MKKKSSSEINEQRNSLKQLTNTKGRARLRQRERERSGRRGVARRDLVAESRGDETKQKKEHLIPKKAYKIKFNQPAS